VIAQRGGGKGIKKGMGAAGIVIVSEIRSAGKKEGGEEGRVRSVLTYDSRAIWGRRGGGGGLRPEGKKGKEEEG